MRPSRLWKELTPDTRLALAEADMGDVGLRVVGELHGAPSEELDDRGDDEPVAIVLDNIDFRLFRVERHGMESALYRR